MNFQKIVAILKLFLYSTKVESLDYGLGGPD
jgi:hypothetical protein